jgi:hypothetical protein
MWYGDEGEDMTQVPHRKQESGLEVGKLEGRPGDLLFVGRGDVFKDDLARRVFRGYQWHTISRAMGLPDALKHLESKNVDLVLLGREFHEEDSSQFVLAARRGRVRGTLTPHEEIPNRGWLIDRNGIELEVSCSQY